MSTVDDIIKRYQKDAAEIQDLENSLRELRGMNNWEIEVGKDQRPSVKLLWATLRDKRSEMRDFLDTRVELG